MGILRLIIFEIPGQRRQRLAVKCQCLPVMGPAGCGKSTLALQYVCAALDRGEKALFISFDETRRNFYKRATGLQIEVDSRDGSFEFMAPSADWVFLVIWMFPRPYPFTPQPG